MTNTPQRAEWWKKFLCEKCQFPATEKLRAQFLIAELSEFCDCGCNSFKVQIPSSHCVVPIAERGCYRKVFEANFQLVEEGKTLEVILFVGEDGNLAYVEIDCCGNSSPVPDAISVIEPPFHVHASSTLVP